MNLFALPRDIGEERVDRTPINSSTWPKSTEAFRAARKPFAARATGGRRAGGDMGECIAQAIDREAHRMRTVRIEQKEFRDAFRHDGGGVFLQ